MRAFNYGLKGSTDRAFIKRIVDTVMVPEFVPKSGVKIQSDPKEEEKEKANPPLGAEDDDDVAEAARLLEQMQVPRVHGMGMHNFA